MKHTILILLTLSFLGNIQAQEPADKMLGVWYNEDKTSQVEMYKSGDTYAGKIVWIAELEKNPNNKPTDKNNPNPELRNREIIGLDIITGLKYSGGKWVKGQLYTPKRGMYANCSVELLSDGSLKLTVSKSGMTRTQTWTSK